MYAEPLSVLIFVLPAGYARLDNSLFRDYIIHKYSIVG